VPVLPGLNLSTAQIATELDRNQSDVHQMTGQMRHDMVTRKPLPTFIDAVECDEVSIVAGHKSKPYAVTQKGDADGADGSRASGDETRLLPEKPPIVGIIPRGGGVVIWMVENV
jgi:transposase